jgi:hypothetical protein
MTHPPRTTFHGQRINPIAGPAARTADSTIITSAAGAVTILEHTLKKMALQYALFEQPFPDKGEKKAQVKAWWKDEALKQDSGLQGSDVPDNIQERVRDHIVINQSLTISGVAQGIKHQSHPDLRH